MLVYYGYTVSPNQVETGEGFLICRNVPIARTGSQKYLGREINLSGSEADRIVTVHRSEEEGGYAEVGIGERTCIPCR